MGKTESGGGGGAVNSLQGQESSIGKSIVLFCHIIFLRLVVFQVKILLRQYTDSIAKGSELVQAGGTSKQGPR